MIHNRQQADVARYRIVSTTLLHWSYLVCVCVCGGCECTSARFADGQDERRIEELHKRRNFLAAYCKLIVYNVAPIRRAADVFKHYIKCYNDYGDIIKATLSKAREINKLNCALTMQLAMQALFQDIAHAHRACYNDYGDIIKATLSKAREINKLNCALTMQLAMQALFQDIAHAHRAELAKRFSVMFGLDAVKNREALTALHRAGIAFAALELAPPAPPPNLLFLEPLTEFSGKLLRQDKRQVLKVPASAPKPARRTERAAFLDARIVHSVSWGDEWAPFMQYRNSLLTDAPDERPPPAARRHYTRRNRGQTEEEEGDDNAESDQEAPG
ncbi:putative stromal antigen [Operophtera brumata]|uniref:Putative stromal antigen n=1 Tax=Operophtera brumata TaxID=104452 RepID=A0A0L7LSU4_OPEBR|nr:putative stromal antigen [Operophtera brumata]